MLGYDRIYSERKHIMDEKLKELQEFLAKNNLTLLMFLETPSGEQVRIENVIPKELMALGWKPVLNLAPVQQKPTN